MDFLHPETGESLESQADFQRALGDIAEQLAPFYRTRRLIEEARAERFEPVLPTARSRTPTQDRVARCPRCGERVDRKYVLVSAQCYHGEHADCSMPSPYLCSCPCHKSEEAP